MIISGDRAVTFACLLTRNGSLDIAALTSNYVCEILYSTYSIRMLLTK
jgi:hypothetical protein